MKTIPAIPIKIDGIQFRSRLEGRFYLFMKRLGWNFIYEPDIKGLNNWIPDFLIIGKDRKILVDVKPIDKVEDWEKHPDRKRIEESGIKNLLDYELLILGTNLRLDGDSQMGLLYVRDSFWPEGRSKDGGIDGFLHSYERAECVFSNCGKKFLEGEGSQIGFMDGQGSWHCRISGEGGKTYLFRDSAYNNDSSHYKFIDTCWNEAGTQVQWNTPTSEYYLKGKTHPNKNQYCLDCKTKSVNWWKKKNLFYCTECKEVKPLFCYEEENLDDESKCFSPKHYSVHSCWSTFGEKCKFYYATKNSPEWN
jgi:hypothetical protein